MSEPPKPIHVKGMHRGEEKALHSREPGRDREAKNYRTSRDSTGINPKHHGPILPVMPSIPPA